MTGPYIVTTKQDKYGLGTAVRLPVLSRVAVATLEEARDAILAALDLPADADLPVQEPHADGSMTITLPDGTVIEVKPTTWMHLAVGGRMTDWEYHAKLAIDGDTGVQQRILDTFNRGWKAEPCDD